MSDTYRVEVRVIVNQTFELQAETAEDAQAHFWEGRLIYNDIQDEEILSVHTTSSEDLGPIAAELP